MANVKGMILAIDDFFIYLIKHPELIPSEGMGKFIRTQFDKILKPTLLACLHAKGDKVEGNPAHLVADAFYRNMNNFLSHIIKTYAARNMPSQKLEALVCEFIGTQREMMLQGSLGGSILFEMDPDSPKPQSKSIFNASSYSAMDDEMPRERKFIAAGQFYLSHACLYQPVFHQNLSKEDYVEYLKRFLKLSCYDLHNAFIQQRFELHPAVMLALIEIAKLDNAHAYQFLVSILSTPLEERIVCDLINSNEMVGILLGDGEDRNLNSADALVILQNNTVTLLKNSHLQNHVVQRILGFVEYPQLVALWQHIGSHYLSHNERRKGFMSSLQHALAVEGMQPILGLSGSECVKFILDMQEKTFNKGFSDGARMLLSLPELFSLILNVKIADRFIANDLSLYMSHVSARNHCSGLFQQLWACADSLDLQQSLALIKESFAHYPEEIRDKLHKFLMNKCESFTEGDMIKLLRMYFTATVNKQYLQDPQFVSVVERIATQINSRATFCLGMPLEQLKLALKTFPRLHCLNTLENEKADVSEEAITTLVLRICAEAEPERFALLKNENIIRSCCAVPLRAISNQLVQALWRVQSVNDLAGVAEMTREVIAAPDYNLLDLIINVVPETTIKNIFARFGGNEAIQQLFKNAFDRHCLDMLVADFSAFIRGLLTNNALSGSKIEVMHECLVKRYVSQYSEKEALQLLVAVVLPGMNNNNFTLNIDVHMSKFVATSIFTQLVKEICQYANENIAEVMRQLHLIHPVVTERLYAMLTLNLAVLQQLVVTEGFDRKNPLQTAYRYGNAFNEFAGRSLVSEYVHQLDHVSNNAVVALVRNPDAEVNINIVESAKGPHHSANMLAVLNEKTEEHTFDPLLYHYRNHNLLYTRADILKVVFASNNLDLIEQYCWKFILFGKSIDMLNSIVENLAAMSKDKPIDFANAKFMAALVRKAYHLTSDKPTAFVRNLLSCGLRCQAFSHLPSLRALIGQLIGWDQAINRHIDKNGWNPPRAMKKFEGKESKGFLSSFASSSYASVEGSFYSGHRSAPAPLPKNILHKVFMSAMFENPQIFSEIFVNHATVKSFLAEYETYTGSPLPSEYVIQLFRTLLVKKDKLPRIGQVYADSLFLENIIEILEICRDQQADLAILLVEACPAAILAHRQSGLFFLRHSSAKYHQELLCFMLNQTESGFSQAANSETIVADMNSLGKDLNNARLAQVCCEQPRYRAMIFANAESLSAFVDTLTPTAVVSFFEWLAKSKPVSKNEPTMLQQCLRLLSLDQLTGLVRLPIGFSLQLAKTLFLAKIDLMKIDQPNHNLLEITNCIDRLQVRYPHSRSLVEFLFLNSHPMVMRALTLDHLCLTLHMKVEESVKVVQPQDEIKCQVIQQFPINANDDQERQAILRDLLRLTFNSESFHLNLSLELKTSLLHRLITELGLTNKDDSWLQQCLVDAPKRSFKPAEIIFSLLMIKAELLKNLRTKNLAATIDDVLFKVFEVSHMKDFVLVCNNADTLQRMVALLSDRVCDMLFHRLKFKLISFSHELISEIKLLMSLCMQKILSNSKSTIRQLATEDVEIAQYLCSSHFLSAIADPWNKCHSQSQLMVLQLFSKHFGFELLMSEFEKLFGKELNSQPVQVRFVFLLNYAVNNQLFSAKLMTLFDSKKLINSDTFLPVYNNVFCPLLRNVLTDKQWKSTELFITVMINYIKMDASLDNINTFKSLMLLLPIGQNFNVANALCSLLADAKLTPAQAVMLYSDLVIDHSWQVPATTRLKLSHLCAQQLGLDSNGDICQQLVNKRDDIPVKMMDCLLEDFAHTRKTHGVLSVPAERFMNTMLMMISNDIVIPEPMVNIIQYLSKTRRAKGDNVTLYCDHATLNLLKLFHLERDQFICKMIHQQRQAEGRIFIEGDMMFMKDHHNLHLLPLSDQDFKQYFKGFELEQGYHQRVAKLQQHIEKFLNLRQVSQAPAIAGGGWFWEADEPVVADSSVVVNVANDNNKLGK